MPSPGQQIFVYQENNLIPADGITASVSASGKPIRVHPKVKNGNGNLKAYGAFTGALDTEYEVIIVDTDGSYIPTKPLLYGVGDGTIKNLVINDLTNQRVRIICKSVGVDSEYATITFAGLQYRCINTGTPGNLIYFDIGESNLVFTSSNMTTIQDLSVGDTGLVGTYLNFNTPTMEEDVVPNTSYSRIAFGLDRVNIYVQYRVYDDEERTYKYYFIRPIQRSVPKGSIVYYVSGGRTITISNSTTTETYSNIVTSADFWQAVKGIGSWSVKSQLIEPVDLAINTRRTTDSFAVTEVTTKTDAYYESPYIEGSNVEGELLENITVNEDAYTELLEMLCIDNDVVGGEIFRVTGPVSGDLGTATVGEEFTSSVVSFIIKRKLPTQFGDQFNRAKWNYKFTPTDGSTAALCFSMKLGIAAKSMSFKLKYTEITTETDGVSNCTSVTFDNSQLGLKDLEGGGDTVGYYVEDLVLWSEIVYNRMRHMWVYPTAGRPKVPTSSVPDASDDNYFTNHTRIVRCQLLKLAAEISNLEETSPATLVGLVDDYKDLFRSLMIFVKGGETGSTNDVYPNGGWFDWDGEQWVDALDVPMNQQGSSAYQPEFRENLQEVAIDWAAYQTLWESVQTYQKAYGVKKKCSIPANCEGTTDNTATYYWKFEDAEANYLPAYSDTKYYSTVNDDGTLRNTHEFGLYIEAITGEFAEGDEIEVNIEQPETEKIYQIDDKIFLSLQAGENLYLSGGIDGDDNYIFAIEGQNSDLEGLPDYTLSKTNPESYSYPSSTFGAILSFFIDEGDIPFEIGDYFQFYIEGGHYKYRYRTVSNLVYSSWSGWSALQTISNEATNFDSGIKLAFDFGAYPSFELGDSWLVIAEQENRASNMLIPLNLDSSKYKGSGSIIVDCGTEVSIYMLVIDMHNIATDVLFQTSNSLDFSSPIYEATISNTTTMSLYSSTPITARYFKFDTADSTQWSDIEIGYLFLGPIMQLTRDATVLYPKRNYVFKRTPGKESLALLKYKQLGFNMEFSGLTITDFENLINMFDYLKENGDQSFYFMRNLNVNKTDRLKIEGDQFNIPMPVNLNADEDRQYYSIVLPILGSI